MSVHFDDIAQKLQPHYSKFKVSERLLFSGHSHQAWPDVALQGQQDAFDAAAELVDDKWHKAFEKTNELRAWLREFYDDANGYYSCAPNTHDLIIKWLSALPLTQKPRIITTDAEFYSLFRQLRRLREENIEIVEIPHLPLEGFAQRLEKACNKHTAAVMISRVYFQSALCNQELPEVAKMCRSYGIPLLIDDYHGTNVLPFSIEKHNMDDCYFLIGGYKYMQWGEGNCFLRFPKSCTLRPALTGWFASFQSLTLPRDSYTVQYDGEDRFAGATYDPVSQFRAARVTQFFREMGLTPDVLAQCYRQQIARMAELFEEAGFDPQKIRRTHSYDLSCNAGFLSLTTPHADTLWEQCKKRNIFTDFRGEIWRWGPAPYITDAQIVRFFEVLKEELQHL